MDPPHKTRHLRRRYARLIGDHAEIRQAVEIGRIHPNRRRSDANSFILARSSVSAGRFDLRR
jgi:hypothetical protein